MNWERFKLCFRLVIADYKAPTKSEWVQALWGFSKILLLLAGTVVFLFIPPFIASLIWPNYGCVHDPFPFTNCGDSWAMVFISTGYVVEVVLGLFAIQMYDKCEDLKKEEAS